MLGHGVKDNPEAHNDLELGDSRKAVNKIIDVLIAEGTMVGKPGYRLVRVRSLQ